MAPAIAPPPAGNPPEGSSSTPPADKLDGGASTGTDKKTSAPAPAGSDKQTSSYIPLDLADLKAILSRISEGLRPTGSATTSGTGAQPKQ
jgi:hypothetical protein